MAINTKNGWIPAVRELDARTSGEPADVTGADVALTGYVIGTTPEAAVVAADTVNAAIAKLEKRIADLEAAAV